MEKGIDAWVDKWEMFPGDSLVDKIFEEGLKNASGVIVIISKHSIYKPWVKEELNNAFVNRISNGTKIIPVVIDDCEVPESLKSTLWQNIRNLNDYDEELDRIVMSIYGVTDKPRVGNRPTYVTTVIDELPGLTRIDTIIMNLLCKTAISSNSSKLLMIDPLVKDASEIYGINESDVQETLDILNNRGYIKATKVMSGKTIYAGLTTYGFDQFISTELGDDYNKLYRAIALRILNSNRMSTQDIASDLDTPIVLINHFINILINKGFIKGTQLLSGNILIHYVSPELKRLFS